jgi:hypothetical protein
MMNNAAPPALGYHLRLFTRTFLSLSWLQ